MNRFDTWKRGVSQGHSLQVQQEVEEGFTSEAKNCSMEIRVELKDGMKAQSRGTLSVLYVWKQVDRHLGIQGGVS